MPSRPFAIGFVKVYAEALGLEAAPIVSRFKEDAGFSASLQAEETLPEPQASPAAGVAERSDMSLAAVVGVLIFILWCAFQITQPRAVKTPYRLDGLPTAIAADPAVSVLDGAAVELPATGIDSAEIPVMIEAKLINNVVPVYPVRCEAGAAPQETVEVGFTVTAEGGIASERVINSSNSCFDRPSLNAVRRWRFEPRTVDGVARPAFEQRVTFPFKRPL